MHALLALSLTYNIKNAKGETPSFRVLDKTVTEQALALAAITALNTEGGQKIPVTNYVDLKFQQLTLKPIDAHILALRLKLSGRDVDLEKTVSKDDLLKGKTITVDYPKTEKDVAMYDVTSSGQLKMHLDKASGDIILENVEAKMSFESPLGEDGTERVQFSGRAVPTKDQ